MTRTKLCAGCILSIALLAGCEDDKKAELLAKTAPSAKPPPPPAPPVVSATASAPPATIEGTPRECQSGPSVKIEDPDFDFDVHFKLKKEQGTPLTMADLANVRSLNLTRRKAPLAEINPCLVPKMVALKELFLPPGTYRDLKPIANLNRLESLRVSISEVEDLKPLEKLVSLDRLDLGRTHVRDISILANLVNLTELELDDDPVSDLGALAKCKKLEKLSIKRTTVTDVSPLKDLPKLKFLYVEGCAINNLDTLNASKGRGLHVEMK